MVMRSSIGRSRNDVAAMDDDADSSILATDCSSTFNSILKISARSTAGFDGVSCCMLLMGVLWRIMDSRQPYMQGLTGRLQRGLSQQTATIKRAKATSKLLNFPGLVIKRNMSPVAVRQSSSIRLSLS
jgi:hypothetical protein